VYVDEPECLLHDIETAATGLAFLLTAQKGKIDIERLTCVGKRDYTFCS
jgi:hypothetical protein